VLGEEVPKFSLVPNIKADFGAEIKMASVQTLKELAEQTGLKGAELREFIKEQQDLEREERNQQRENDRIQQDKEDKFRLAQMEREREKDQQQHEKDREFEIERIRWILN